MTPGYDAAPGRHQGLTSSNSSDFQSVRTPADVRWHVVPRVTEVIAKSGRRRYSLIYWCPNCARRHEAFVYELKPTQRRRTACRGGGMVVLHTEAEAGVPPREVAA